MPNFDNDTEKKQQEHVKDLRVPCPASAKKCFAKVGEPCTIKGEFSSTTVHFGRRLNRLYAGIV